ncbi:MAG: hypothetical protein ACP5MD_12765, partial [Verrucomicrobiia bacterium]
ALFLATESQQIFRRVACLRALIKECRSLGSARQATLVPATPGWKICGLEDSTEIAVRLYVGCLAVRFSVWIH